jgi:hypothetical protein
MLESQKMRLNRNNSKIENAHQDRGHAVYQQHVENMPMLFSLDKQVDVIEHQLGKVMRRMIAQGITHFNVTKVNGDESFSEDH